MPYNFSGKIAQRRGNRLDSIVKRKLAAAGANFASADRGARRSAIGPNQVAPINARAKAGMRGATRNSARARRRLLQSG